MIRILASLSIPSPCSLHGPFSPRSRWRSGRARGRVPEPDRPVAEIVAPRWSSEAERDRAGEFEAVAKGMGIAPGETVADIGAGSGYYVVRLSPRVGPGGRVLAEDVDARITSRTWRSAWPGSPT